MQIMMFLAIDDKDENIQEIADTVTYAVRADVREPGILKSLGVQNVDTAIMRLQKIWKPVLQPPCR